MIYILSVLLVLFILIDLVVLRKYLTLLKSLKNDTLADSIKQVKSDWSLLAEGITDIDLEKQWLRAARHLFYLFAKKNNNYGSQNLALGWVPGIVLRMGDKISRLWQLVGFSNKQINNLIDDEGRKDTFLDLANYGIVGYLMELGLWPKAKIEDAMGVNAQKQVLIELYQGMDVDERNEVLAALYTCEIAEELGMRTIF